MQKGTINVQSENIFPIIKKFLYSDHDIFLRELVSNAVDATQKLKTLAQKGETGEIGDTTISLHIDKENKTLTISDKGIGMTEEEVEKYINQIAFSSAQEFVDKYDDGAAIIGHFGLGFYSSFMVSDKVEIETLSYKEGAEAVKWSCKGDPEYKITKSKKKTRGTDIILHINEESSEFLEDYRITELLNKYCKFLPVEIQFGENKVKDKDGNETDEVTPNIINNPVPAWTKKPKDLTDEDYKNFYKELYPYSVDEPLFWIHLNVDFPFKLTGILYFPKLKNNMEIKKDKIGLYSNQVFVTDNVENIVPEFLMLLHGVIDSPDIPLNVSRSYLQGDPNVKKISAHITKKVAAKLESIFKNERDDFEKKWENIGVFIKYGMLSDTKFDEKAKKFALLETTSNKFHTIDEHIEAVKATQTDKDSKTVILYTSQPEEQDMYIEQCASKGYEVVKMDNIIDTHFIGHIDNGNPDVTWKRVDAETIDKLIEKDETMESVLSEEQQTTLKDLFGKQLGENSSVNVEMKALSPEDFPVTITKNEFMRRMRDMNMYSGMNDFAMPDMYNLVINTNHPLMDSVLKEEKEVNQLQLIKQLHDLALLQQNMLKGSSLTNFIKRSFEMVK